MTIAADHDSPARTLQGRLDEAFTRRFPGPNYGAGEIAEKSAGQPPRRSRARLSRAACLHLINQLARFAPTAVAIILFVTACLAARQMMAAPVMVGLWAVMVMAAGGKLMLRNRAFLAGDAAVAARPFHWRACHTANLAVLGTAFGAGVVMVIPAGGGIEAVNAMVVMVLVAFGAGASQMAHGRAALALVLPVVGFVGWRGVQTGFDAWLATLASAGIIAAFTALAVAAILVARRAGKRYPRTVYEPGAGNVSRLHFRRKVLPSAVPMAQKATG